MEPLRPEDPTEIGGFPLLARIGAGGMGQVYLGLADGGRHVALKVIREDFDGPQALARFRREVATVERVRSRFAAAMVGAGLADPPYWLATEYVPGPTLRQAVAEHGPLPTGTCLRLLAALAHGLLEIHRQGVQHRDLKPGNVILAPDGPRLIDFGIARGEGQTQITQTGAWNGTPGYVAPEVVREQQPVPASDVFSLAGTVAYAATGRPPFGGGRIEALIHRTLSGEIDVAGVDPRLAELIGLCAAKTPDDRIPLEELFRRTASEGALADDPDYRRAVGTPRTVPARLEDAIATGLVPPERTTTGRGPGMRSRAAVIAAGAAAVVVVLAGAFGARVVLQDDGTNGAAQPSAQPSAGTTGTGNGQAAGGSTTGPDGSATGSDGTPAGRTPGPDGRPPDELLVKQPTTDYQQTTYSATDHRCLPALRPEDSARQRQMQISAPRVPYTEKTVKFGMRHKWDTPAGYYVAAEVRVPRGAQIGNGVSGAARSKPQLVSDADWVYLNYPTDFEWSGSGGAYPLMKGTWTIVWLHVHPNGDAYYIGCDGFTVA
ncbi:hypothetical protein BJF79_26360 [Actinomadura sp. CNU-125]|uniref:serine/threonine protein kinase n=1 Tax=Actinomadura sp. CNU-125 TaxID=1904961 RepID=UPI0009592B55|nr:serine/threonine-protein kinase [Actinomadura sp. CNU-125]OLT10345.1 hypothetical protein BJF79_26360 [Actinomadura sp. CNU-125]